MALPKAYLTSARNLPAILNAIQTAKAPQKFTQRFLESLEFKSPHDRLIIGVLKALKFLNDDGTPTSRYFAFLDQTVAPRVLAEGVREAYDDLFQVNINAQTLSKAELINKFRTLSQGQFSESVLDKMAMTFAELVKLADFTVPSIPQPAVPAVEDATLPGEPKKEREDVTEEVTRPRRIKVDGLVYNIQLILPESRDQVVYDALFRSLREHLG
jgi:hypothetical protein